MEPPADPDAYTHRSGRTGRAGRKGTSAVLASPREFIVTARILKRAGIAHRMEPVPTPETIRRERDERLVEELTSEDPPSGLTIDERMDKLAKRLAESGAAERTIARLLAREAHASGPQPREVRVVQAPVDGRFGGERDRVRDGRGTRGRSEGPSVLPPRARSRRPGADAPNEYASFHVSWGESHGADARRLLALVCRRGGIRGADVGAIRVGRTFSMVEVSVNLAGEFAEAVRAPDPRDPRVVIRPEFPAGRPPAGLAISVPQAIVMPVAAGPRVPPPRPSRPRQPPVAESPTVQVQVPTLHAPAPRPSRPRQPPVVQAPARVIPARQAPQAKPSSRTLRARPGEGVPKRPKRTGKKRPPPRG